LFVFSDTTFSAATGAVIDAATGASVDIEVSSDGADWVTGGVGGADSGTGGVGGTDSFSLLVLFVFSG
jgi:hypothetical protein